eukprot:COSAG05_NODE_25_length_31349_cov_4.978560_11_plen_118_part_00
MVLYIKPRMLLPGVAAVAVLRTAGFHATCTLRFALTSYFTPSLTLPLPPPSLLLLLPQQGLTATEFYAAGHAEPMAHSGEADPPQSAARNLLSISPIPSSSSPPLPLHYSLRFANCR